MSFQIDEMLNDPSRKFARVEYDEELVEEVDDSDEESVAASTARGRGRGRGRGRARARGKVQIASS